VTPGKLFHVSKGDPLPHINAAGLQLPDDNHNGMSFRLKPLANTRGEICNRYHISSLAERHRSAAPRTKAHNSEILDEN